MPIKVAGIVESFGTEFAADIFRLFIFWPVEQPKEETRMVKDQFHELCRVVISVALAKRETEK